MPRTKHATKRLSRNVGSARAPQGRDAQLQERAMANPLLQRWTGPSGGVPPFDQVKVEPFKPALETAMAEQLGEIDAIAANPAPPTFENTIAAMERSGRTLDRVDRIYSVWTSTLRSPGFRDVERDMEPKLAQFRDRIVQNERLFKRISAVYESRERSGLSPEQQRLTWLKYNEFARSGARLDASAKKRLSQINERLASLYTEFSQNVLADEGSALYLKSEADLAGLPESLREAAAEAARERGRAGEWAILNTRSSMEPFLTYSDRRELREKVWRAYYSRGDNRDARDNKKIIAEIVREAMFWVAGALVDLESIPARDAPVYHADVRVWEVKDDAGKNVALFYFDPYARVDKRSGAWMNEYRSQERFEGEVTTIVSNNSNFVKGKPGEPVLVSWGDAVTLFHEFGHALHGLSSNVTYPSLAGTAVDRDYVEFPSQLIEHWLATPEVLNKYARHCKTGEAIPQELVRKIERASKFNKGFENVEYLSSALVDMRMHLDPASAEDVAAFEKKTLDALGMPHEMAMRHRLPHFGHLFNSDSYAAGYYSYLWADTLSADAFEAFTEAGGAYDKSVAKKLREHVFSTGNTIDPEEGYRAFRGRDAEIDALMRRRGFRTPASQ